MTPRPRPRIPASIGSNQALRRTRSRPAPSCYRHPWRGLRRRASAGHGSLNKPEITPPSISTTSATAPSLARFPSPTSGRVVKRLEILIASFSAMPILHPICRIGLAVARFSCDTRLIEKCRTGENQMSKGSPGQGASSAPPKRRGRPNLPAGEGKRYALGLRTTKELRDLLQQAADSSGRSLAQEIEFRLERSFERERTLAELLTASLGGERTSRHVQALAGIACNVSVLSEQGSADAWLNDHKLFTLVRERWNNYLDTFQPSTPNTCRGKKVAIELLNMIEKAK